MKSIVLSGIIFGIAGCFFALQRHPQYLVEATFREKSSSKDNLDKSNVQSIILGKNEQMGQNTAIATMKSEAMLGRLVRKLNLHGSIINIKSKRNLSKRIKNNLKREIHFFKGSLYQAFPDTINELQLSKLSYENQIPLELQVKFLTEEIFTVTPIGRKTLGNGELGKTFSWGDHSFVLNKKDHALLKDQVFNLTLLPPSCIVRNLKKSLVILPDNKDITLIKLSYQDKSKENSSLIINSLMEVYLDYLAEQNQMISNEQILYLTDRANTIGDRLQELLEEQAQHTSNDIFQSGYPNTDIAMSSLTEQRIKLKNKISHIDDEISLIESTLDEGYHHYESRAQLNERAHFGQIIGQIRELKKERDALKPTFENDATSFADQPIDLKAARALYEQYLTQRSGLEASILQNQFILEQFEIPGFEITSLSTVLQDPVSTDIISRAGKLLLEFNDHQNHTDKEQNRLAHEIHLQKKFLSLHVEQTLDLQKIRQQLINDNIKSLQVRLHSLIEKEISLLEKHLNDHFHTTLIGLRSEKESLLETLGEINAEQSLLPKKWISEHLIAHHLDLNKKMVEKVSQLVENKNLNSHLDLIISSPLDKATSPLNPKPPLIFLHAFAGIFAGSFLMSCYLLLNAVIMGVKVSDSNLKTVGAHVSGMISSLIEDSPSVNDLETLRRLDTFLAPSLKNDKVVISILGKGPNYCYSLSKLMSKSGLRVIVVPLSFDESDYDEDVPGILQYLEGKAAEPTIISKHGYDTVSSGGKTFYGTESLFSPKFLSLIKDYEKTYDRIIAYSTSSPVSAEAEKLLSCYNNNVVTLVNETLDQLTPILFHVHDGHKKLTFVFGEINQ